jgi:hypothetical protein
LEGSIAVSAVPIFGGYPAFHLFRILNRNHDVPFSAYEVS